MGLQSVDTFVIHPQSKKRLSFLPLRNTVAGRGFYFIDFKEQVQWEFWENIYSLAFPWWDEKIVTNISFLCVQYRARARTCLASISIKAEVETASLALF